MKNRWTMIAALIALVLVLSNIKPTFAQDPVGNLVGAELSHGNWCGTDEDSIDNIPLEWDHQWFAQIGNTPDGGPPVLNPKVELQTNLNLIRFNPDDPSVFTARPELGLYSWNFNGLQIEEPAMLPLSAWEPEETLIARSRFSASRFVEPEILTDEITLQTITLTFKLEEPLPPEVNQLLINIGSPVFAYEDYRLVEGYFVSQIPVEGWVTGTGGVSAWWVTDPSNVEVGKTYMFQATLESVKSPDLLGSPLFKPGVLVHYARVQDWPPVTGDSITITHPDGIITATFSADNVVDWTTNFSDYRFDFWFNSVVSEVTPPPPPFYVLVPADVRIEPETLNLRSEGVITAFVQLPEQYSVEEIEVSTVTCQGAPAIRGMIAGNTLILKFERQDLQDIQPGEEVELLVTGQLTDGSIFEGTDAIRVID